MPPTQPFFRSWPISRRGHERPATRGLRAKGAGHIQTAPNRSSGLWKRDTISRDGPLRAPVSVVPGRCGRGLPPGRLSKATQATECRENRSRPRT